VRGVVIRMVFGFNTKVRSPQADQAVAKVAAEPFATRSHIYSELEVNTSPSLSRGRSPSNKTLGSKRSRSLFRKKRPQPLDIPPLPSLKLVDCSHRALSTPRTTSGPKQVDDIFGNSRSVSSSHKTHSDGVDCNAVIDIRRLDVDDSSSMTFNSDSGSSSNDKSGLDEGGRVSLIQGSIRSDDTAVSLQKRDAGRACHIPAGGLGVPDFRYPQDAYYLPSCLTTPVLEQFSLAVDDSFPREPWSFGISDDILSGQNNMGDFLSAFPVIPQRSVEQAPTEQRLLAPRSCGEDQDMPEDAVMSPGMGWLQGAGALRTAEYRDSFPQQIDLLAYFPVEYSEAFRSALGLTMSVEDCHQNE
jgi:hypothetical protein